VFTAPNCCNPRAALRHADCPGAANESLSEAAFLKILWTVAVLVMTSLSLPALAADGEAKKGEVAKADGDAKKGEVAKADADAKKGEVAKADAQRKKPLQRCDQLKGDAELDCLKKARERVVEARKKRESTAKGDESKLKDKEVQKDTSPQKK
jgi:hypothetical protein